MNGNCVRYLRAHPLFHKEGAPKLLVINIQKWTDLKGIIYRGTAKKTFLHVPTI